MKNWRQSNIENIKLGTLVTLPEDLFPANNPCIRVSSIEHTKDYVILKSTEGVIKRLKGKKVSYRKD